MRFTGQTKFVKQEVHSELYKNYQENEAGVVTVVALKEFHSFFHSAK